MESYPTVRRWIFGFVIVLLVLVYLPQLHRRIRPANPTVAAAAAGISSAHAAPLLQEQAPAPPSDRVIALIRDCSEAATRTVLASTATDPTAVAAVDITRADVERRCIQAALETARQPSAGTPPQGRPPAGPTAVPVRSAPAAGASTK